MISLLYHAKRLPFVQTSDGEICATNKLCHLLSRFSIEMMNHNIGIIMNIGHLSLALNYTAIMWRYVNLRNLLKAKFGEFRLVSINNRHIFD